MKFTEICQKNVDIAKNEKKKSNIKTFRRPENLNKKRKGNLVPTNYINKRKNWSEKILKKVGDKERKRREDTPERTSACEKWLLFFPDYFHLHYAPTSAQCYPIIFFYIKKKTIWMVGIE